VILRLFEKPTRGKKLGRGGPGLGKAKLLAPSDITITVVAEQKTGFVIRDNRCWMMTRDAQKLRGRWRGLGWALPYLVTMTNSLRTLIRRIETNEKVFQRAGGSLDLWEV
jgi:hypothetical protein